ncbi:MAG: hypothetical protein M3N29_07180, partial [Chloroflexota bacterium]|nr:hypothetical protein [Chloroflexota bacterium]
VLDVELAALLWLLADRGVPLVVASRSRAAGAELRSALTGSEGGLLIADSLEEVLRLSGAASGTVPDELREMGVVVVLRELPDAGLRVAAAHYIRRLERDAGGHVQRRPPAVLAARDERDGRLEHFAWGVTTELAEHAGLPLVEFQRQLDERAALLEAP